MSSVSRSDCLISRVPVDLPERAAIERANRTERDQRLRNMRAIAERCAAKMPPGISSLDHGDLLYDEHGLPK